jgi:hypothetical protein
MLQKQEPTSDYGLPDDTVQFGRQATAFWRNILPTHIPGTEIIFTFNSYNRVSFMLGPNYGGRVSF